MNLYDVVNKDTVLEDAFKHPALKIKPRSKQKPTLDVALKAVQSTLEYNFVRTIAAQIQPTIDDILLEQILMDGEHADSKTTDAWEQCVDDKVEACIENYVPYLSADWLGRNTIASGVWEEDGINKFCASLGREVFKQLTYGKTPIQIMSNVGIVQADVEAMLASHLNATEEEKETMTNEQDEDLQNVIQKIADRVGKDFDQLAVYEDLELVSDDDDILANGAAPRLGLDPEDIDVLRTARFEHEDDTAQVLVTMLEDLIGAGSGKKKPAAKAKAPAEKKTKAPKLPKNTEDTEGQVDPKVLQLLKEHGGAKDADLATLIGTSRATYNNYVNGKTAFSPTSDQYSALRDQVIGKLNGLHEALAALDGTEAEVVF